LADLATLLSPLVFSLRGSLSRGCARPPPASRAGRRRAVGRTGGVGRADGQEPAGGAGPAGTRACPGHLAATPLWPCNPSLAMFSGDKIGDGRLGLPASARRHASALLLSSLHEPHQVPSPCICKTVLCTPVANLPFQPDRMVRSSYKNFRKE
jgi:hypothetical protein